MITRCHAVMANSLKKKPSGERNDVLEQVQVRSSVRGRVCDVPLDQTEMPK